MKKIVPLFGLLLLTFCGILAASEGITLHKNAQEYPVPYQGPFVRTADNALVTLAGNQARRSDDEGKTWETFPAIDAERFQIGDFSVVRANDGTMVAVFCNNKELRRGKWGEGSVHDWEIPIYSIRSLDGGKTWSEPLAIQRDWVGALRALVTLKSGRIVLAAMAVAPWQHIIPVYVSDDAGQSWTKTQTISMEGSKINDHDGAMEPKLIERADGSVFMLIRTTKGTFYRSISTDEGQTWSKPESTGIENNNSFGELAKLSDGRWILIWNRDDKFPAFGYQPDPNDWVVEDQKFTWFRRRDKLSLAISPDEGKTWSDPIVIASNDRDKPWIAYAVFFEPQPGTFWIATQQGNVKMMIREKDL